MKKRSLILFLVFLLAGGTAFAADSSSHGDPIAHVLVILIAILAAAKLGGAIVERFRMPAVLGELIGGIVLGNLVLLNPAWSFLEPLRATPVQGYWAIAIDSLSRIGVIILLFEVGLESTVKGMLKVGGSSFLVAVLGVIAPFILGYWASWIFIAHLPAALAGRVAPGFSTHYVHLYVGAVLCATSVGITARVFKDLGRLKMKEAQIILGAAVIDDVLGLIVLAVVSGIVSAAEFGQPMAVGTVIRLILVALLFLGGTLIAGSFLIPRLMKQLSRLRTGGMMLISALGFCFALAYLADLTGLAPIVGAFAAGLLLEDVHFRGFNEDIQIEDLIKPVSTFLVPVFFVLMGIQVRLESFANVPVLGLAAGLTIAAVAGKQICGFGVLEKNLDRLSVGVGMIPRGEVGLILASIGKNLKVVDDATFSAVVIMIIVTTLIAPPLLKLTLSRKRKGAAAAI
ncbi:MAG TPA: cation:proton antiporter [Acidobacteriota bacterium]|nr:cation:proton antiporter [Acidobacteriota bacterium]